MIQFKNFNGFDSTLLNSFNGMEPTERNLENLKYKIEDLYMNDSSYDYSTKSTLSWMIFDRQKGSVLEILIK